MKRLAILCLTVVAAIGLVAGVVFADSQEIWLEPFASDGERSATTLQIDGGHFWVAVGIYAFERTPVTVRIPYQPVGQWPNQTYRYVGTYISEGVSGEWLGFQDGHFVFTGDVGPYAGKGPDIVGLELEAVLDSVNEFVIIVEANGREHIAEPVTVIIGNPPPAYKLFLPLIIRD